VTIEEAPGGNIVVSYNSSALTKLMLVFATLFLGVAGYDVILGERGPERLIGLVASSLTCFLVAIVFLEIAWFQFARDTGMVTWHRRWALRRREGSLPFTSIEAVIVERPMGDDGTPSRRIALRTIDGKAIPITMGYRADGDGAVLKIADRIRSLLGHSGDTHQENVRQLIASGKTIDAIRVLREEEGLNLLEAKQRVDELSRRPQ
jgi:hypothetical protein